LPPRKVKKKKPAPSAKGRQSKSPPKAAAHTPKRKKAGRYQREVLADKIIENDGNVSAAARQAGYAESTAQSEIYRTIRHPDVQQRLQQRLKEANLDKDEIHGVLNRILRADIDDLLGDDGRFSLERARKLGVMPLVKKIKFGMLGYVEGLELYSALDAAKILAKVHGLEQEPQANEFDAKRKKREKAERKIEELMLKYGKTREEILERCPSLAKCLM
jgi:hypothetical protein